MPGGDGRHAGDEDLAAAAGLRYLADDRPGIRRVRRGRGFSYHRRNGSAIEGAARRRLEALVIPPAWTEVWIAPEADAHLLATGRDDRGRKQYIYHPDWRAAADLAKFEHLGDVGRCLATLRKAVDHDLRARTDEWPTAAMVRLIDVSLIRPGSRRNLAENGSVGATTLGAEHISIEGRRITLDFDGKSAVEQHVEIDDLLLARRLSSLIDDEHLAGLFVDRDDAAVDAVALNDYIARHTECDMTAKFLRTWGATCAAADYLLGVTAMPGDVSDDESDDTDARIRRAVEYTADRLGNTPAVCRASYIAPTVVDAFESGELEATWRRSRRTRWLSRTEQTVRRVLQPG